MEKTDRRVEGWVLKGDRGGSKGSIAKVGRRGVGNTVDRRYF